MEDRNVPLELPVVGVGTLVDVLRREVLLSSNFFFCFQSSPWVLCVLFYFGLYLGVLCLPLWKDAPVAFDFLRRLDESNPKETEL